MTEILLLAAVAFVAGFVDSVVGGGGLIQLPALLIAFPGAPIPAVMGTNKLSAIAGTGLAAWRLRDRLHLDARTLVPTALAAFAMAFVGARLVSRIDADVLRPVILVLLVAVAAYTFLRKDFGAAHEPRFAGSRQRWAAVATGATLGLYDGFFGPGMGSFLIFVFVGAFGFDFLGASAAAKVINLASNVSAVLFFAGTGNVLYRAALPMAAANLAGAAFGIRTARLRGAGWVRGLFLVVVSAVIARFAWDLWSGR